MLELKLNPLFRNAPLVYGNKEENKKEKTPSVQSWNLISIHAK